jgi:Peptidase family S41
MSAVTTLNLNSTIPVTAFRSLASGLSTSDKQHLVQQALVLFEGFYAHLPAKRAMYAVDPVQRLRVLMNRLSSLRDEPAFHQEMITVFNSVRDLHTNYLLGEPFASSTAFVPFIIDRYFDSGRPRFIVTRTSLQHDTFIPGVEVTHWNGMPIHSAVEVNAERNPGTNPAARFARGLTQLTVRPLSMSLVPDEDWVTVTYLQGGRIYEIRFPWLVFRYAPPAAAADPNVVHGEVVAASAPPASMILAVDADLERTNRARKILFHPEAMKHEAMVEDAAASAPPPPSLSKFPNELEFRDVNTRYGTFGYLRIRSFNAEDVLGFVAEVRRILQIVSQNGLIIDIRENPGGIVTAGEMLLQLFTDRSIEPEPVRFIADRATRTLTTGSEWLEPWRASLDLSVEIAAVYSQGFPLLPLPEANRIGRVYPGPTMLITDALCYSTSDIFAAGYQDHEIGPILGVASSTGAGGANVWTHEVLRQIWPQGVPNPLQPLPAGMSMRVAVRRSERVGPRHGMPLEDLGVVPNIIYEMTRADLLQRNVDLIERAASLLVRRGG